MHPQLQLFRLLFSLEFLHFKKCTINAVINEITVYASVAIRNVSSNAANVTIKKIANINAATAAGFLSNFSSIADIIITAIGNAKKINKR